VCYCAKFIRYYYIQFPLSSPDSIGDLRVVVLDEDMLDDDHRGYLLELFVTKLLFISIEGNRATPDRDVTLGVKFYLYNLRLFF
jgi:hypothetical protein